MKKATTHLSGIILFVSLSFITNCTSSSVGGGDISEGRRQVTGRVLLDNRDPADGAFVWIEGFDVGTFADGNGAFTLELPSTINADVSGVFMVYFFIANYELRSVELPVRDGEFIFDTDEINSAGALRQEISLTQFLNVRGSVTPATVSSSSNANQTITFSITIQALVDTATIILPRTTPGFLSAVFFENSETGEIFLFQGQPVQTEEVITVDRRETIREMDVTFTRLNLPLGRYEFYPYLLIRHQIVPTELLQSIGQNVLDFGPGYVSLPFVREGGNFVVN